MPERSRQRGLAAAYRQMATGKAAVTPRVQALADEITAGTTDRRDRYPRIGAKTRGKLGAPRDYLYDLSTRLKPASVTLTGERSAAA